MKHYRLMILLGIFLLGCSPATENYLAFDNVSYVTSFPQSYKLDVGETINIDEIGIQDISIVDSLLLFSKYGGEYFISVYDLSSLNHLGDFWRRGNGQGELNMMPYCSGMYKSELGENRYLSFFNQKDKVLKWNLTASLNDNKLSYEVSVDSISGNHFSMILLSDDCLLGRRGSRDMNSQVRYLKENGKRRITDSMKKLNEVKVPVKHDGFLFNVVSAHTRYASSVDMVVEASVFLNTINMYSIDGTFEKTVCVGKKMNNVDKVCNGGMMRLQDCFESLRVYDDSFAVLYSGAKSYSLLPAPLPKIYLFDFEGNPLIEFLLSYPTSKFDIDFSTKSLYTLDVESETVRRYDISALRLGENME